LLEEITEIAGISLPSQIASPFAVLGDYERDRTILLYRVEGAVVDCCPPRIGEI